MAYSPSFCSAKSRSMICSMTFHSSSDSCAIDSINRRLKESSGSFISSDMKSTISWLLVLVINISPEPVRSHSSFTSNSRHIEKMMASDGARVPASYPVTVDCLRPNRSPNSDCVNPSSFLNSRIRFFTAFSPFDDIIQQEKTQRNKKYQKNIDKRYAMRYYDIAKRYSDNAMRKPLKR